jgi:hypothetical protein
MTLSEVAIGTGKMPIGESPKNKPSRPATAKLKATESTRVSGKSMLFLPMNNMLTKQ